MVDPRTQDSVPMMSGAQDDGGGPEMVEQVFKVGDLSLLSWNILAECYFSARGDKAGSEGYTHVKDEKLRHWPERLRRILAAIMRSNADVVCLQEVMFAIFEEDLVKGLDKGGYDGLMQNDRKRGDSHPQGVATFWRRDKLSLRGECHRSRTAVAVLEDAEGRRCAVVNCHLEGRPDKSVARVKQLQTTMQELVQKHEHHSIVLCGDFNCQLGASACGAYLAFGAATPGILEWGREVPVAVTAIPRHPYGGLTSAYDMDPLAASLGQAFTYCQVPGHPVDGLDQIWYHAGELVCVARRPLFASDEERLSMIRSGLPSPACPSDHIPVGASFNWIGRGAWHGRAVQGRCVGAESKEGCIVAVGDGGGGGSSSESLFKEASALLAACPLTDSEHLEFVESTAEVDGVPKKGKPPPEVIAVLREQRRRKDQLLKAVSDEARQILMRVITLRKQANKRQAAEVRQKRAGTRAPTAPAKAKGGAVGTEGGGGAAGGAGGAGSSASAGQGAGGGAVVVVEGCLAGEESLPPHS